MFKKAILFLVNFIDRFLRKGVDYLLTHQWCRPLINGIQWLTKNSFYLFFKIYFRLEIRGKENVPQEGGLVIACNHQSYLDPPLVAVILPRYLRFISKRENFDVPIMGPLIKLAEAYPINRSGDDTALKIFAQMLREGHPVVIFPENTIPGEEELLRSHIDKETGLLRGKTGAIRLALMTKSPIIPLGITGAGKALPPEAIPHGDIISLPRPHKIIIRLGKPIYLTQYYDQEITYDLLRELTNKLMREISSLVDHEINYIPIKVPVSEETFQKLKAFEAKLAEKRKKNLP